jgi:hypothetical protein
MELWQMDVTASLFLSDGQKIQVGLAHARKTVEVTVAPDTYQITVETGITVIAARTTSRDIRRHKASNYGWQPAVRPSQASGGELCCLTLPLNSLIARVGGVTLIAWEIKELIVEQDEKERLERGAEAELNRRCGDGAVQKVEVLQYGDEPAIEPGQAMVRVILTPTGEDPDETLHAFEKTHNGAIEELRKTIARTMPFIGRVELTLPAQPGERKHPVISMSVGPPDRTAPGRNLTPVMARLDPRDVEVLDALITAGIVSNRADGLRWALNRIRERPAYTQLREHIGKIDELKAQL